MLKIESLFDEFIQKFNKSVLDEQNKRVDSLTGFSNYISFKENVEGKDFK
jgi:hypothetical protein